MKLFKKIAIFTVAAILICSLFPLTAFAAEDSTVGDGSQTAQKTEGKLDMNLGGEDSPLDFGQRLEYALQGTVTGMLMVFGVLSLLAVILYGSKFVFNDLPNKKKIKAQKSAAAQVSEAAAPEAVATPTAPVAEQNDGELAAVITAAVAAMLEGEEYKNEFVGGFRVVSFKRSEKTAWNRK
jgi:sodium pump decarboxylase gamma subunit